MAVVDRLTAKVPLHVRHRVARVRLRYRVPTGSLRVLPDFLVIGAQRSGTSSLYRYLGAHPRITPSFRKEVEYFSRRYGRGETWYRAHFPLKRPGIDQRLTFEATPDYLFHPLVPARATALLPAARYVVLLRDPVERAWSHYRHMVRLGYESLPFDQALEAESERIGADLERLRQDPLHDPRSLLRFSYVARGMYEEQLLSWFAHVPRDRMLVLRSEDLFGEPVPVWKRLLEFLDLPPWQPKEFENHSARSGERPSGVPPDARRELRASFAEPNKRLCQLLDAPIHWP